MLQIVSTLIIAICGYFIITPLVQLWKSQADQTRKENELIREYKERKVMELKNKPTLDD